MGDSERISLDDDRPVFKSVARSSYLWQDYYEQRSAVGGCQQPVWAGGFGFKRPSVCGLAKVRLCVTMALTMALGESGPAHLSAPAESCQIRLTGRNADPLNAQGCRSATKPFGVPLKSPNSSPEGVPPRRL